MSDYMQRVFVYTCYTCGPVVEVLAAEPIRTEEEFIQSALCRYLQRARQLSLAQATALWSLGMLTTPDRLEHVLLERPVLR